MISRSYRVPPRVIVLASTVCLVGGALLLAVVFLGGAPPPPEETPPPAPVKWEPARMMSVGEWTEVIGTTQPLPERAARITAPIEGRVISVLQDAGGKPVVEGQPVKKGDVIAQLDAALAKANREKIAAAQEELKQQTKQAEFALKLANIDVTRLMELSQTSGGGEKLPLVSRIEMEKAQVALHDAESKLKAAELRELAAKKELQALDEQLKLYSLTALIDGRLGRLLVVPGQTLAAGTLVSDIIDIDEQIDVLCFAPAHVGRKFKKGDKARIGSAEDLSPANAAGPDGQVEYIAEQAELDTGNFAVKVRFPNKSLGLRANTVVRISILTSPEMPRLVLPESALFEDQDPPTVIVVEGYKETTVKEGDKEKVVKTGTARKLRVKLGIRNRAFGVVEIVGLEDPDTEKPWKGTLVAGEGVFEPAANDVREEARFVTQRGRGLRTGDPIRLEEED